MSKIKEMLAMSVMFASLAGGGLADRTDTSEITGKKFKPNHKGLKKFVIGGREIWAINEKNAERKYRKIMKSA